MRIVFLVIAGLLTGAAPAAADDAKYAAIPPVFNPQIRAGDTRDQVASNQLSAFRLVARNGVAVDKASVEKASARQRAAQRASAIGNALAADLDGDGRISLAEATEFAAPRGLDQFPATYQIERVSQIMAFDADHDGFVDLAELRAGVRKQQDEASGNAPPPGAELLALLDGGRTVLTSAEFSRAAERAFETVDLDGDTVISRTEWLAFRNALGLNVDGRLVWPPPPPAPKREADEEAFFVGVYQGFTESGGVVHGPRALVAVDRPGKQVTLLLCSHEPVRWSVTLAKDTRLKEVRLFGRSEISEVLVDGKLIATTPLGRDQECPYEIDEQRAFSSLERLLPRLTGFATLTGFAVDSTAPQDGIRLDVARRRAGPKPLELKPRDPSTLPAVSFAATLRDGSGLYDLTGKRLELRPAVNGRTTEAPERGERYALTDGGLIRSATKGDEAAKSIPVSLDAPPLSSPTGLAYDSKRNRILVISMGGEGYLHEYDLATEKWRVVASMKNEDFNSLVYDEKTDRLWTFGDGLVPIGPDGATEENRRIDLKGAQGFAEIQKGEGGAAVQLTAVGDGKAVLVAAQPDNVGGAFRIYLVDLATGAIDLTGASD